MGYMNKPSSPQSRTSWKGKSDLADLPDDVASHRSRQHEQFAAGWRRNVLLAVLAVSVAVLFRVFTAM